MFELLYVSVSVPDPALLEGAGSAIQPSDTDPEMIRTKMLIINGFFYLTAMVICDENVKLAGQ
jgi:hypothetical protein